MLCLRYGLLLILAIFSIIGPSVSGQVMQIELTKVETPSHVGKALEKYDKEGEDRRRNLAFDKLITLGNHYDFQYYGNLYMGSHRQNMTFIFDTGSSWLWVTSDKCPASQCSGDKFHYASSTTYRETTTSETITYGKGQVKGYITQDQVSLTNDKNFAATASFLAIYQAAELTALETDGLMGLSPNFVSTNQSAQGGLYVTSLFKSKLIGKNMFAMQLRLQTSKSQMWFGGYDESVVRSYYNASYQVNKTIDDLIAWMNLTSKSYWQVKLSNVTFGNTSISLKVSNCVFDSGSSLTYVPTNDYNQLKSALQSSLNNQCYIKNSLLYCPCTSVNDTRFPQMALRMANRYTFYMKGSDYLIYDPAFSACVFSFLEDTSSSPKYWLLGDPFLRTYYAIFDVENQKVGLAGLMLDEGPTAETGFYAAIKSLIQKYYYYVVIGCAVFVVLLLIVCLCCCKSHKCCCFKQSEKMSKHMTQIERYPTRTSQTTYMNTSEVNNTVGNLNQSYKQKQIYDSQDLQKGPPPQHMQLPYLREINQGAAPPMPMNYAQGTPPHPQQMGVPVYNHPYPQHPYTPQYPAPHPQQFPPMPQVQMQNQVVYSANVNRRPQGYGAL